jgi:hypothetical protein
MSNSCVGEVKHTQHSTPPILGEVGLTIPMCIAKNNIEKNEYS